MAGHPGCISGKFWNDGIEIESFSTITKWFMRVFPIFCPFDPRKPFCHRSFAIYYVSYTYRYCLVRVYVTSWRIVETLGTILSILKNLDMETACTTCGSPCPRLVMVIFLVKLTLAKSSLLYTSWWPSPCLPTLSRSWVDFFWIDQGKEPKCLKVYS